MRVLQQEVEQMSMLINILSNNGYIIVNKEIIKKMGLHEAIILGELCSEYSYWEKSNKLDNGYFYSTRENIEKNTGLSAYQQREPFKKLIEKDVILEKLKGMPQKKWYSINMDTLYKFLIEEKGFISRSEEIEGQAVKKLDDKVLKKVTSSYEETKEHDVKILNTNNNNNNNKINNNKYVFKNYFKSEDESMFYENLQEKFGGNLEGLYANNQDTKNQQFFILKL